LETLIEECIRHYALTDHMWELLVGDGEVTGRIAASFAVQ
jgi:hypothetical protein